MEVGKGIAYMEVCCLLSADLDHGKLWQTEKEA